MVEDSRKNIKVEPETFDQLREDKDADETWDDYLIGLFEDVPRESREMTLRDEQINEIARTIVEKIKTIR